MISQQNFVEQEEEEAPRKLSGKDKSQYCCVCGEQTVSEDGINLGHSGAHGRWARRPNGFSREDRAKMCQVGHSWSTFPCQHGSVVIICDRCGKQKGCAKHRLG